MIVFRVDANEQVATGHLMRTLSIASACRKRGLTCEFWLAEEKETERIAKAGFPYRILKTRWDALEDELPVMKQRLQAQPVDWLVVDSYCATVRYLAELNRMVPVFYVDDFRREHYEVSALLQYIPCRERQKTPEGLHEKDGVQYLTGFLYAPLREEFSRLSFDKPREKSILLSTGGTDPYNMAGRILAYGTRMQELQDYLWHVIVGSMNRNENMQTRRSYFTRIFPICGATCSSARRRSRRAVQRFWNCAPAGFRRSVLRLRIISWNLRRRWQNTTC